jgi:hypothetical protein
MEFGIEWSGRLTDALNYRLRQVASRLTEAGVDPSVWTVIYHDNFHDNGYAPGDEERFLHPDDLDEINRGSGW